MRAGLRELAATDVLSVTDNEVIFSRRMVRDANRAAANKANGLKGGNPVLMDQPSVNGSVGDSVNRSLNPQIPEARSQKPETRSQKEGFTQLCCRSARYRLILNLHGPRRRAHVAAS